ncbi:MAG TPA: sulfotransferase [Nocardioidaceae bacterium]
MARRHFLVIGAQRSGTTFLHTLLEAHPDIVMARPTRPEPKVFLGEEVVAKGAEWYVATYFAHAAGEHVYGEKSTSYIEAPEAAGRARAVLGDIDVVALLRDPVERAVSNWRFSTDNGFETRSLEEALVENLESSRPWDPSTTSVSPFSYLERGRFSDYLGPWLETFPGRVHVRFLRDLLDDYRRIGDLYAVLGADSGFLPPEPTGRVNQSDTPRPRLSEELEKRLREYFADSDRALRELAGRDLPWPTLG